MSRPRPLGGHVLITGTSTGIGRACALQLAREGFSVWGSVRNQHDAMALEQAGKDMPTPIRSVRMDVTDLPSIRAAETEIRAHVGASGLYGIVNNAGICVLGPAEFVPLEHWRHQLDVNFIGAIAVTQIMLPLLRIHNGNGERRRSRIINMCSITGEISTPLFSPYSASKFALRALNDALRLELREDGIHLCLIVPGTIQSEIWRKEKESVDAIASDSAARRQYGTLIDNVAGYVFRCAEKALPAQRVAEVVQRCFTRLKPGIEYRVGWEAEIGARSKKSIPDRVFDWLLARTLGVPKSAHGR